MKAKAKKAAAAQKKTPTRQPAAVHAAAREVELPAVLEAEAPVAAPIANDVALEEAPAPLAASVVEEPPTSSARPTISTEERRRLIASAAYQRAERLGFGTTDPVEDWLAAEREVDAMLGQVAL